MRFIKVQKKLVYLCIVSLGLLGAWGLSLRFWPDTRPLVAVVFTTNSTCQVHTPYGNFDVTEPVLIDLLQSKAMERIKHVRQYGVLYYSKPEQSDYSRYEHCVGVWALLRHYGCSLEEQIAGLLHDASHTVFSHVGDILFKHYSDHSSYQDDIHEWYLKQMGVDLILAKHHMSLAGVLHKSDAHKALEQDLPDMCADRFEYNLRAGLLTKMLTRKDILEIINNVTFEKDRWSFSNKEIAKKFSLVSLYNTEHTWGALDGDALPDIWAAEALSRALDIKLLTFDDIHFSTDDIVWNKLTKSTDKIISTNITKIMHPKDYFVLTTAQEADQIIKTKFRGIDPLVKADHGLKRLTELDDDYKKEYERVKAQVTIGWPVKFVFETPNA